MEKYEKGVIIQGNRNIGEKHEDGNIEEDQ
jgi:hypothetical protein